MEYVASTMQRLLEEEIQHRRLFLIQTYGIGKERVFLEVGCLSFSTVQAFISGYHSHSISKGQKWNVQVLMWSRRWQSGAVASCL